MILNMMLVGDTLYCDVQVGDTTVKRKTAMTFQWDGEDLLMDNMDTLTESVKWMYFGITLKFSLNMGWIQYRTADENELDHVVQGPNLLLVPKDKKGPKADLTGEQFYDGSILQEYPNGFHKGPVMWVVESQGWKTLDDGVRFMVLSNVYHWRFVRMNDASAQFHAMTQPPVIERPLHVNVNLIESQWVE